MRDEGAGRRDEDGVQLLHLTVANTGSPDELKSPITDHRSPITHHPQLFRRNARIPYELRVPRELALKVGGELLRSGARLHFHAQLREAVADVPRLREFHDLGMGLLGQSSSGLTDFAKLGISFGVGSILLHNSRSAESQADEVGTYVLYHSGYDPRAMAQFFQIIEKKYPQQTVQFFSDHPVPENRIKDVDEEIPQLGPPVEGGGKTDSPEFQSVKKRLLEMPPPPKPKTPAQQSGKKENGSGAFKVSASRLFHDDSISFTPRVHR